MPMAFPFSCLLASLTVIGMLNANVQDSAPRACLKRTSS